MEVEKAISQISEIHSQISRSEHYRGLRALPVALTGATAIFAGFFQHQIINSFLAPLGIPFSICFVLYWCSIAVISLVIALSGISRNYFLHDDTMDRKKTIVILENFLPCLVVGMIVTLGITSLIPTNIALLPGIWTLVFTLGVFAARPFLPRIVGWV
ncbi:MAG: hypothetical protein JKX97_08915, partial [Candidatus Lindowbacteria bacterium]|nr:hypothetical protein [Candidatus Lindowbacteria bacterium]